MLLTQQISKSHFAPEWALYKYIAVVQLCRIMNLSSAEWCLSQKSPVVGDRATE